MWTPDALKLEAGKYENDVWRVVEDQWKAATVRITDTLEEQALLEQILDETKPALPPEAEGFDFLLATPFRYLPYPYGSRFRRAEQIEGVFYASETSTTAIAELAFYRLLFFRESPNTALPSKPVEYTAICVPIRTGAHIDLSAPPLDTDEASWTDFTNYGPCQDLADSARAAGIELIRYRSVRDPEHGTNVAVLTFSAFAENHPTDKQTWKIFLRPHVVQAWCERPRIEREYPNDWFAADARIG